ncbi:MAG: hypothetical protein U0350_13570 [Caldilineaceae bacterium]
MTMVEVPVQIRVPDLVKVLEQLPANELDELILQAHLIQKRHQSEADLLETIYHPLPADKQARLRELSTKSEMESITEPERAELLKLVEVAENASVARAEALIVLAQKRQISIDQLLHELNLGPKLG